MAKFYQVGGCVRDEILGIKSKDIDYAVEAESWEEMVKEVTARCSKVFLIKPEYFTIRGLMDKVGAVDFVLCRKEGEYHDSRRPESVEAGTLLDDLSRRDFTMNAIAKTEDGRFIDHFDGIADIKDRTIRCVGSPQERFSEDGLRILRAIRFSITKGMALSNSIYNALQDEEVIESLEGVSVDRVREELTKCFSASTRITLNTLYVHRLVQEKIFDLYPDLWFKPTTELV